MENTPEATKVSDSPVFLEIGARFDDKYEIIEVLGSGARGVVYKARHLIMGQFCALKVLRHELVTCDTDIARFQREAKLASQLQHINIVSVRSFGINPDGLPYLVMDYLEGRDLSAYLAEKGILSCRQFKEIFLQICDALEFAHSNGIVHRDIKAANIFLSFETDGKIKARLIDLGLAKAFDLSNESSQKLTRTGVVAGTPRYMSPEQCKGAALSPASDIYSLGVLMFESLTGQPLFSGATDLLVMQSHLQERPEFPSKSRLPDGLKQLVLKILSKDPSARGSALELSTVLASLDLDEQAGAGGGSRNKMRNLLLPGLLAALIAGAFMGYMLIPQAKHHQENPVLKPAKLKTQLSPLLINQSAEELMEQVENTRHDQDRNTVNNLAKRKDLARRAILAAEKENDLNKLAEAHLLLIEVEESEPSVSRLERLRKLLATLGKNPSVSKTLRFRLFEELGNELLNEGQIAKAREAYKSAISLDLDAADLPLKLHGLRCLSVVCAFLHKDAELKNTVDSMLKEPEGRSSNSTIESQAYLAQRYAETGKRVELQKCLQDMGESVGLASDNPIAKELNKVARVCSKNHFEMESKQASEMAAIVFANNKAEGTTREHLVAKRGKLGLDKEAPTRSRSLR